MDRGKSLPLPGTTQLPHMYHETWRRCLARRIIHFARCAGRSKRRTVVPAPRVERIWSRPRNLANARAVVGRPRPAPRVPSPFLDRHGSVTHGWSSAGIPCPASAMSASVPVAQTSLGAARPSGTFCPCAAGVNRAETWQAIARNSTVDRRAGGPASACVRSIHRFANPPSLHSVRRRCAVPPPVPQRAVPMPVPKKCE